MSDPKAAAAAVEKPEVKPDGRKGRKGKKGRVMTFVYSDESGKLSLSRVKTNAFSVTKAWEEAMGNNTKCKKLMALQGLVHEVEGETLRKPTYDELAQLAGLVKVTSE